MELAQGLNEIQGIGLPDFKWINAPIGYIISYGILPLVFGISGILLLLYLLFGGLQFMFSRGDPKAMQSAQGKITNALIGFVIIFLAFWLTQLFGNILNIPKIMNIFK